MLRRQRIIRNRIHKLVDAALFALGFYLAFVLRSNAESIGPWLMVVFERFGGTPEIQPGDEDRVFARLERLIQEIVPEFQSTTGPALPGIPVARELGRAGR